MTRRQFNSLIGLLALLLLDGFFVFSKLYLSHKWFDIPLHYFGGFFTAMLLLDYLELGGYRRRFKQIFILSSAVIFVGVFWEFFEFIMAGLFNEQARAYLGDSRISLIGDLDDTIFDLALDFLGAFTYSLVGLSRVKPNLFSESAKRP